MIAMVPSPPVGFCDCADCGRTVYGENMRALVEWYARNAPWLLTTEARGAIHLGLYVTGRIKRRPYCIRCLTDEPPPWRRSTDQKQATDDTEDPWQQNAIKVMEGD